MPNVIRDLLEPLDLSVIVDDLCQINGIIENALKKPLGSGT